MKPDIEEVIMQRKFSDQFGGYLAIGAKVMDLDEFIAEYEKHLPSNVVKMLSEKEAPPAFHWFSQLYVNYS